MTNFPDWTDDHLVALELAEARPGMVKLGAMLEAVVEDALAPALAGRKLRSCLHILDGVYSRLQPGGTVSSDRVPLICVQHPDRMLCTTGASTTGYPGCADSHYAHEHEHDLTAGCFVCKAPIRDHFTPIVGQVQLHRRLRFYDDNRAGDHWFWYAGGSVWTTAAAWLCPRHKDLVKGSLRMAWPTDASSVTPEDFMG